MSRHSLHILIFIILCNSCTEKQISTRDDMPQPIEANIAVPDKDKAHPAEIVYLDTCPRPTVINADYIAAETSTLTSPNKNPGPKKSNFNDDLFTVSVTNLGAENGLYSLINVIKKDSKGNFWLGTGGGGVIRFDGRTATNFTTAQGLATNAIRAITEDKKGNFWFGSHGGGASYYDGRYISKITKSDGLSSNNIRGIIVRDENTWFATYSGGISIYNGVTFKYLNEKNGLASNNVNCICESKDGTVWCGTDSGLCSISLLKHNSAPQFKTYNIVHGLGSQKVLCINEDIKGNMWFGTLGGGLSCLRKKGSEYDPTLKTYTIANGLPDNTVKNILEDTKGTLWICTGNGVASCRTDSLLNMTDINGNNFTVYNTDVGLKANKIECVAEDEAGNMWFGTNGGGVSRLGSKAFQHNAAMKQQPRSTYSCINEDKSGRLWLSGNNGGISCFDRKVMHRYNSSSINQEANIYCALEDKKGNIWFGASSNYVYRCDRIPTGNAPLRLNAYGPPHGLNFKTVWCLCEDSAGRVWMGTDAGMYCYNGTTITHYTTAQGLGNNIVWCTFADKDGQVWAGTFGGELCKFEEHPKGGGPARFISYTIGKGAPSTGIKGMVQDSNRNIWMGKGGGGLFRFDGHSFLNYTTQQGISNNVVVSVGKDKKGNIWLGTNEGFTVLKGFYAYGVDSVKSRNGLLAADNNLSNSKIASDYLPVFEKFSFKNGYPVEDLNTNGMYIDTSGIIWAGSADKLIRFDYEGLSKSVKSPSVFITALQVGGQKICWNTLRNRQLQEVAIKDSMAMINEELNTLGDLSTHRARSEMFKTCEGLQFDSISPFYPLPLNLVIPYSLNNIQFDFSAIELTRPNLVRFQYKLDGYDNDWNTVTARTNASFGNIREGKYTFLLRAMSPDGIWSTPIAYNFQVLPPMSRSWWAYFMYFVLGTGCIYSIIQLRIRVLKKENTYLEQVVIERTRQIEQEKAAVEMQAADLKKLNQFKDKTFSILSHDLRGPIGTSTALVTMLVEGQISVEEFSTLREQVLEQLTATGSLLDNLLKWAKGSMEGSIQAQPDNIDIHMLANRNALLFKEKLREKNITLINTIPENSKVWCDEEHMDIILRNLVANAIKFTESGGTITLSLFVSGGFSHITVSDTGVGMTESQLHKLFKPIIDNTTYGTSGEKGTGLGLLLCHEFIKANNGQISVSSKKNVGTAFTVILPLN